MLCYARIALNFLNVNRLKNVGNTLICMFLSFPTLKTILRTGPLVEMRCQKPDMCIEATLCWVD